MCRIICLKENQWGWHGLNKLLKVLILLSVLFLSFNLLSQVNSKALTTIHLPENSDQFNSPNDNGNYSLDTLGDDLELVLSGDYDATVVGHIYLQNHNLTITGEGRLIIGNIFIGGAYGNVSVNGVNLEIRQLNCVDFNMVGGSLTGAQIWANNSCSINNGIVNVSSNDTYGIGVANTITISGENTMITASCAGDGSALKCGQGIQIDAPLAITTPAGGIIKRDTNDEKWKIYSNETTIATSVVIRKPVPVSNNNIVRVNNTVNKDIEPPQAPPCEHSYEWQVIQEPTESADGIELYKCTKCGAVKERNTLPALGVFNDKVAKLIRKTPLGGTVKVETRNWNSFGPVVREALVERADVTVNVSFLSEGHKGIPLKVTLPAGSASLFDNNGYLGLCNVGSTLGYDQ